MKIAKAIFVVVAVIVVLVIVGFMALSAYLSYRGDNYFKFVKTDKPIEAKYTAMGTHKVSYVEFDAENDAYKKFGIWYPSDMKESSDTYPVVIMANGTGITASKYKAVFNHLASWGFIVVGNDVYVTYGQKPTSQKILTRWSVSFGYYLKDSGSFITIKRVQMLA